MYSISVAAVNSLGISQSSLSINFQTEEEGKRRVGTNRIALSTLSNVLYDSTDTTESSALYLSLSGCLILSVPVLSELALHQYWRNFFVNPNEPTVDTIGSIDR